MTTPHAREDILVSVCFAELPGLEVAQTALVGLARELANNFRYWEIIVVLEANATAEYDTLLQQVPNIRILKILPNAFGYRRRVSAASEAIGDVVMLTSVEELSGLDVPAMIAQAHEEGCAVIGQWPGKHALDPILVMLGRSSGFRVSSRDMRSAAFPRTILNRLLAHPNQQLALRFVPHDEALEVLYHQYKAPDGETVALAGRGEALRRRFGVIMQLLISSAPRMLGYSALLSALMALGGFTFGLYAIIVWLTFENVEPGWFSISIGLSLAMAFIGIVFLGLCSGVAKILNLLTPQAVDDVLDERSAVDLFGQLSQELNISSETTMGKPGRPIANAPVNLSAETPAGNTYERSS